MWSRSRETPLSVDKMKYTGKKQKHDCKKLHTIYCLEALRQSVRRQAGSAHDHTLLYLSQHPAPVTIEMPSTAPAPSFWLCSQLSLSLQDTKEAHKNFFSTPQNTHIYRVSLSVSTRLQQKRCMRVSV